MTYMIEVVNAVGSGNLNTEVDLEEFTDNVKEASYDPNEYHGVFIRKGECGPLVILYRTGSFIIRGGGSKESLYSARDTFLKRCSKIGIIDNIQSATFELKNLVCTSDLNRQLELEKVAVILGLESTEYEPEQFSGLIYRPTDYNCTILIFSSGKIVITGEWNMYNIESAVEALHQKLN